MFINDDLESSYSAQIINLEAGKNNSFQMEDSLVLFAIKGSLSLKSGEYEDVSVEENQMLFVHAGLSCSITAKEKSEVLLVIFPEVLSLCHRYIPEVVEPKQHIYERVFFPLEMKKYIHMWVSLVQVLISELRNPHPLLRAKVQELFLLFKICYPKETLSGFLCPVFSSNYDFTLFVLNNYQKVRTVAELVEMSSFSLSGFEKEFRKVFGTTPYQWMLRKKDEKTLL